MAETGRQCLNPGCRFNDNPEGEENCLRCGTQLGSTQATTPPSPAPGTIREQTFGLCFPFGEVRINGTLGVGRDPDFSPIATQIEGMDRVSRRHAEVRVTDTKIVIVDIGSMNGVYVNGQQILPDTPCDVRVGDEISFSSQLKATVTGAGC
jgi:hypothetical protein